MPPGHPLEEPEPFAAPGEALLLFCQSTLHTPRCREPGACRTSHIGAPGRVQAQKQNAWGRAVLLQSKPRLSPAVVLEELGEVAGTCKNFAGHQARPNKQLWYAFSMPKKQKSALQRLQLSGARKRRKERCRHSQEVSGFSRNQATPPFSHFSIKERHQAA